MNTGLMGRGPVFQSGWTWSLKDHGQVHPFFTTILLLIFRRLSKFPESVAIELRE
jgi:hypothetical protein